MSMCDCLVTYHYPAVKRYYTYDLSVACNICDKIITNHSSVAWINRRSSTNILPRIFRNTIKSEMCLACLLKLLNSGHVADPNKAEKTVDDLRCIPIVSKHYDAKTPETSMLHVINYGSIWSKTSTESLPDIICLRCKNKCINGIQSCQGTMCIQCTLIMTYILKPLPW